MDQPRILIVDDEQHVLQSIKRSLRNHFEVDATDSPEEALLMLTAAEYAVLMADQCMPVMEGTQLLEKAREIAPHTLRVMLTGQANVEVASEAINRGAVYRFLTKPWNTLELLSVLRQTAQHYLLEKENRRLHALTLEQSARLEEFNQVLTKKVFVRTRQQAEEVRTLSSRFLATVDTLAHLSEVHGATLGGHARRVASLAMLIGKRMRFRDESLVQLQLAALLHDVGKIGLPGKVLAQKGVIGDATAVYQEHPVAGAILVAGISGLGKAATYVRHHHERFDGTGYPDRLKGTDIPLGARIIAVADAYDNLLNRRDAFEQTNAEDALERIRENSMRTFDPEVVNVLSYSLLTEADLSAWGEEIEIPIGSVRPGMVIACETRVPTGELLLSGGTVVEDTHLTELAKAAENHGSALGVRIRRRQTQKAA